MAQRYEHLTQPLKIRNTVLKTRLMYPCAQPHFLQGPELYPADPLVSYYCSLAKNGAAFIIVHDLANDTQRQMGGWDIPHFAMWDFNDKGCQNYFTHFTHMVHYYGSKLCTSLDLNLSVQYLVNKPEPGAMPGPGGPGMGPMGGGDMQKLLESGLKFEFGSLVGPEGQEESMTAVGVPKTSSKYLDEDAMEEYIGIVIDRMKRYADLGFDAAMVPTDLLLSFMAEKSNHRSDEYGGSLENRLRFSHRFFKSVRRALGNDFLLYCGAPVGGGGMGPMGGGGASAEEGIIWLKEMSPYLDLIYIRSAMGDGLMEDECNCCPGAEQAAALKAAGVTIPIAVSTPYMDLDKLDDLIASGKVDVINSNHMFMCNPHLGEILKYGNGEDLEPCILCHQCRGVSWTGHWMSHCTINPEMGMEYRTKRLSEPVVRQKRVAVVGGGPGGMKAALYLKERGHTPVIFEASDHLGGQIRLAECCDFKWRLTRYCNWLINQMSRKGIAVRLNTPATRELLQAEGYDAIIAAVGSTPKLLNIPGKEFAWGTAHAVYGHEAELGHRVVVIGGASTAAEAAIYLARSGHDVVEICRKNIVAYELNPIRERGNVNTLSVNSGVKHIREATATRLEQGKVYYLDKNGSEGCVECDDIVVSAGVSPNIDLAVSLHGIAPEFYMIGDCREAGNMRNAIFDAYAAAQQI